MSNRGRVFLILIFLVFSIINTLVIARNHTPLIYDEADYFLLSFRFHDLLKNLFKVTLTTTMNNAIALYKAWPEIPPLFSLSISPAHFIPGFNQYLSPLVNFLYLGLLIFLMYRLGSVLRDEQTGILAAFITLSMPVMFAFSRTLYMDFAFTTIVVLNFYLILKTHKSPLLKNFLFLGLATGAGMLYKYTFPIYTFIPLVILFISLPRSKKLLHLTIYLFLSLLIASPYYLTPLLSKAIFAEHVGHYTYRTLFDEFLSIQFYFSKLFIYLKALCQSQIGIAYFFLFLVSLIYFLFSKPRNISLALKSIILTWLIIPYLIIIALPFPTTAANPRHILPLLPAMALLISFFVMELKNLKARYILCFFIVLLTTTQFITRSAKNFLHPQEKLPSRTIYDARFNYGLVSPCITELKQIVIFQTLKEFGPKIILLPDTPYPALIASLGLENELNHAPLELLYLQFYELKAGPEEINSIMSDSRCVVVIHSHEIGPEERPEGIFARYDPQIHQLLKQTFEDQQEKFTRHKKFVLSDKDVYLYLKTVL